MCVSGRSTAESEETETESYRITITDEDKEGGVVGVVLRPYWIVTTYNNWSRTEKHFIFDARTGRLVEDDETQLY